MYYLSQFDQKKINRKVRKANIQRTQRKKQSNIFVTFAPTL